MGHHRENKVGTLKFNIHKADGSTLWKFLSNCLFQLGFNQEVIMRCVPTVTDRVGIYRFLIGLITSNRGLRQGDPIFPYLYLITGEAFSRAMSHILEAEVQFPSTETREARG